MINVFHILLSVPTQFPGVYGKQLHVQDAVHKVQSKASSSFWRCNEVKGEGLSSARLLQAVSMGSTFLKITVWDWKGKNKSNRSSSGVWKGCFSDTSWRRGFGRQTPAGQLCHPAEQGSWVLPHISDLTARMFLGTGKGPPPGPKVSTLSDLTQM